MRKKINFRMLLRIIGGLTMLEAMFMIVPVITALIYGESDWEILAATAAITACAGFGLWKVRPRSTFMGKREGFLLTASVWIVFSLFGMIPFMFCATPVGLSSAFFEAMSAFTTTGATTLAFPVSSMSHGMVIWQALMQWLGGMGIILFTLAIIPALNTAGGMQMFNAEVTGITHDKLRPRISQTAMALWGLYIALTFIMMVLLWMGPMDLFDSICHAFGTLSTGGFSSRAGSIGEFQSDYVLVVTGIFMLLGGMNFAMIYKVVLGRWRQVKADEIVRIYLGAILVFSLMFIVARIIKGDISSWRELSLLPVFQVISTITSTGYIAPGFTMWEPFVLALTFMMMFSGGCAGSTSGGAKIDRLLYLKRYLSNALKQCIHPNAILSVKVNGAIVNQGLVNKVVAFLCLFILLIVGGGTAMSFLGLPPVDSFFSSFSCICNTGFGASLPGSGEDFTIVPDAAKWILSFLMLTGRLEVFTILLLFTRPFWK